jgi:hypothetical protein
MRRLALYLLLLALGSTCGAAKDATVAELKAHLESARAEDRPELCMQIARDQLRSADTLYKDGNVAQAAAAVDDVAAYSEKARDAATQTKKHLKNVEIDVRKMADKLRDIKRTLAFEDQLPVDRVIRRLEDVRTALLQEMFAKDKQKEKK